MASLKLLVVEDDIASLELMTEVFSSLKAQVRPICDSAQAASLINQQKFDGIFLDLEMPGVHGIELARLIRASSWNKMTPIIVVTAHDDAHTMQEAFAIGVTFFLRKPVDRQKLTLLLRTVKGALLENQRRSTRVPLHTPVVCEVEAQRMQGMSWNLSQGGIQVEVDNLRAGNTVRLTFRLPQPATAIDVTGLVAWTKEQRQGIQFTKVNPQCHDAIREFIEQVEKSD